jgi:hypothetical protein
MLQGLIISKMEQDNATIGKVRLINPSLYEIWEINYADGYPRFYNNIRKNNLFPLDQILCKERTIVVLETAANIPGIYIFTMKAPDIIEEWFKEN